MHLQAKGRSGSDTSKLSCCTRRSYIFRIFFRYNCLLHISINYTENVTDLTVSNPSSHDRLFCLPFFCSASTQTVLMCTVGTTEYKGHLNLKRSTTKRHIKTTLQRSTYIDIVAKNDIESHYISLALNAYARCASPRFLRLGEGQADPPGQLLPPIEDPSASHEAIEAWDLIFT